MSNNLEYFPLTENQLGVYYECMQSPGEVKYTMPAVVRFDKEIDAEKLKEAIIKVIEAHPYLKARFVLSDDGNIKLLGNDLKIAIESNMEGNVEEIRQVLNNMLVPSISRSRDLISLVVTGIIIT